MAHYGSGFISIAQLVFRHKKMALFYAPQIRITELLERAKSQVTEIKIFRDNAQTIPTAASYSLLKPGSGSIVENVTAAIDGAGTVSYSHSAGQLAATIELGEGYVQEWTVTISSVDYTFRRMAAIVRRRLYPVISDADLTATYSDLEALRPSTLTSYQRYIDEAWITMLNRMRTEGGGYSYLVMSPSSFRAAHLNLALYFIFRDFHSALGQSQGRYLDLAQEHWRQFQSEYDAINFVYDQGHDGRPDDADNRTSKNPTIYLTAPGRYSRRRIG